MENNLAPCPICGSVHCYTFRRHNKYGEVWWGVKCPTCGVTKVNKQYDLPTDVVDAWNREGATGQFDTSKLDVDMVRAALMKHIPRKCVRRTDTLQWRGAVLSAISGGANCPACGRGLFADVKFCLYCGQAIDWTEETK